MRIESVDHTPGADVPMGGYGWSERRSDGSAVAGRRLRAQCAVLTDASGHTVVLVRADVISVPRAVYLDVVTRLVAAGLVASAADFVLAQSHTHNGPMVGRVPDPYVLLGNEDDVALTDGFTASFVETLVRLVTRARAAAPVEVTLGYAEGQAYLAVNRENLGWAPPDVPVLLARRVSDGAPHAVLFGHACHPVCHPFATTTFDADHCGRASAEVERRLGVPALFFQGAAGDLNPASMGSEAAVRLTGDRLADSVVAMVRNNAFLPVDGPFRTAAETIDLPFSVDLADSAAVERLRRKYQQRADASPEAGVRRHAERMLDLISRDALPRALPMTVQRLDLGGLTVLALAHEVTSGYHVGTKNAHAEPLWVMAYANHVDAYVAADDLLWRGGYAAGWQDDPEIAGAGTAAISYLLPAPLRASPRDQPGAPDCAEGLVTGAIRRLLDT
ncbi:hypothetical protein Lesp01_34750 [Lentzea sp. NBRC 102530]|nr:hypothetical protein Lesp01_34750 [Lentzea sp. NBRC 102530]